MSALSGLRRPTLRTRLTLTYAAAFAIAGAALVVTVGLVLASALDSQPSDTVGLAIAEPTYPGQLSVFQSDSVPAHTLGTPPAPLLPVDIQTGASALWPAGTSSFASTMTTAQISELSDRVMFINEASRASTLRTVVLWSVAALVTMLGLAVWFGWILSSRVLAPLHTVTATARRVADNNLHERIGLDGPSDEIKDLADTFDQMLGRLDRAFDAQRRFSANASHELRTPLTINRTVLEVAADDPDAAESTRRLSKTLLEVNDRQEKIIEGLLALASADQSPPAMKPVDLGEVVARVVGEAHGEARDAEVEIRVEDLTGTSPGSRAPVFAGDQVLVERLVRNLVDNAVRYNRAGGTVTVGVRVEDARVGVTVENTGPQVPASEVDGLFEPFRRLAADGTVADRSAPQGSRGAGLGLSIVRSVVAAHDGSVSAAAREDGGLVVTAWCGRQPALVG